VSISFDSIRVASATASSAGGFRVAFRVPAAALPEAHRVRAAGTAGTAPVSATGATATFTVFTPWSSFRFGPSGTGLNPDENVLDAQRVPGLAKAGSFAAAGSVRSTPILVGYPPGPGRRVIFGSDDGIIYGLDPATGHRVWSFAARAAVDASPTAVTLRVRGVNVTAVLAGTRAGSFYALNACTGARLWNASLAGGITPRPPSSAG
jgi:PQQ-like domain